MLIETMNQDQIALEYRKLLLDQIKALTANECFIRYEMELSKSIRSLDEEFLSNKDVETSSEEERYLQDIKQVQRAYQIEAHQELITTVKRLTDKAIRRQNEIQKKMELFCKRHGLNADGTPKVE